ncbi:MAG: hypothetical protein Q4F35_04265 [Akkermansia sp.]|nr:hypothetical protein [Akkermansia sp.]
MNYITNSQIEPHLTYARAVEWVRESFSLKKSSKLPHKISIPFEELNFMNTMPCMVPELNVFGAKIVTRYSGRTPSVNGELLLYRYDNGELLCLMDAYHITTYRTGAVAALAVETFARDDFESIGVMGLGSTGIATIKCLSAIYADRPLKIHLLRYKDHIQRIDSWLKQNTCWEVCVAENAEEMVRASDVVISCITYAGDNIAPTDAYRPGCLVVPVHTRGFQNCDLAFDKVFADDTSHVCGFRYFDKFRSFAELPDVLDGTVKGRENNEERILSYNIGIALHDMVYAHHLYGLIEA